MEPVELNAKVRHKSGDGYSNSLRREGFVPAILYGPGINNLSIEVSLKAFEDLLKVVGSKQVLLNLNVQNGNLNKYMVMLKEIQNHPVTKKILHIDFYAVDLNRKIRIKVPVTLKGKSIGVEKGGVLQLIRRKVEILCYPMDIQRNIDLDVSDLDIGDSIHVKDIKLEEKIELPADVNFTVVTVLSPKVHDVKAKEEGTEQAASVTEQKVQKPQKGK
ncbi:MAG: 50S ribosomal protein L25 [Desulfobacterales bacterium]|nr:50S ribosomal protein L25 [Desulfobacterales bacterium]